MRQYTSYHATRLPSRKQGGPEGSWQQHNGCCHVHNSIDRGPHISELYSEMGISGNRRVYRNCLEHKISMLVSENFRCCKMQNESKSRLESSHVVLAWNIGRSRYRSYTDCWLPFARCTFSSEPFLSSDNHTRLTPSKQQINSHNVCSRSPFFGCQRASWSLPWNYTVPCI